MVLKFALSVLVAVGLFLSAKSCLGGEYNLVIKSAVIKTTKSNGTAWDIAQGEPDPYVKAFIVSGKVALQEGATQVENNTYRPTWDEVVLTVREGDDITIQVVDKDLTFDDVIGEYKFTVTRAVLAAGEHRPEFDQVKELRFVLTPK